jgi:succinate dehydrogenase/fumarate reductase flavoprotein subunit
MNTDSFDLVVIGAGAAGLCAAMAAADDGAKVLQIEKTDKPGGTFWLAGGSSSGVATRMQFEAGILDDSPSLWFSDCMQEAYVRDAYNPETLWYYCQNAGFICDWLDSLGAYPEEFRVPREPIYGEPWTKKRSYFTEAGIQGGDKFLKVLLAEHEKRMKRGDVQLMLNTAVSDLIQDSEGKVIGVTVSDGSSKNHSARAVVLCTGGFTSNIDLVRKYKWPNAANIASMGWHGCTGDGLTMCEKLSVKLAYMEQEMAPYPGGVPDPENPGRQLTAVNMDAYPGVIWVGINGKRMNREDAGMRMIETRLALANAPEMTLIAILDKKIKDENPSVFFNVYGAQVPSMNKTWEEFEQMAQEGSIVKKADTLDELAQKLELDPSVLKETINTYNGYVAGGKDLEFGRQELKYKIENPPFYGVKTCPTVVMSNGGPATNDKQQVIHENGRIIPGLYAAGEITAYRGMGTGSGNIGAMLFGKLAGRKAAEYALCCSPK